MSTLPFALAFVLLVIFIMLAMYFRAVDLRDRAVVIAQAERDYPNADLSTCP